MDRQIGKSFNQACVQNQKNIILSFVEKLQTGKRTDNILVVYLYEQFPELIHKHIKEKEIKETTSKELLHPNFIKIHSINF